MHTPSKSRPEEEEADTMTQHQTDHSFCNTVNSLFKTNTLSKPLPFFTVSKITVTSLERTDCTKPHGLLISFNFQVQFHCKCPSNMNTFPGDPTAFSASFIDLTLRKQLTNLNVVFLKRKLLSSTSASNHLQNNKTILTIQKCFSCRAKGDHHFFCKAL